MTPEADTFRHLIEQVRAGDDQAAADLVQRYEPMIRRAARVRLTDRHLGRVLDSMDICQSVLASFFVRAALGHYDLSSPEQLLKLLATMARNKLANQANAQRAARRDVRRVEFGADHGAIAGPDLSPSRHLGARELLEAARTRFTADELRIIDFRQEGAEWTDVAAVLGGTPEALRKKHARAVARVAHEIGLDVQDDA